MCIRDSHNYVYDPDILSPAVLPKEMRERIHKKFSNVFDKWKLTEFEKMFGGSERKKKWEQAIEYTKNLDEIRKQNIKDYLPEFTEYF